MLSQDDGMVTRRRVVLAVNPSASFGRRAGAGEEAERRLTVAGFDVRRIAAPDIRALEAAVRRALAAGADVLVVVGGDGMVHLGVGVVAGTGTPLGIVPTGTGNDFARVVGYAAGDPTRSIDQLIEALRGPTRTVDAMLVTVENRHVWAAGVVSCGFDAKVNERANSMRRPRGASRNVFALLRELAALRPIRYAVSRDRRSPEAMDSLLLAVANSSSLGGGMRIAPGADPADGLLDIVAVMPMKRIRFLQLFPRVFQGTHVDLEEVQVERAGMVTIDAQGVVAYADGERLGRLPVRVDIVPDALHLLDPSGSGVGSPDPGVS